MTETKGEFDDKLSGSDKVIQHRQHIEELGKLKDNLLFRRTYENKSQGTYKLEHVHTILLPPTIQNSNGTILKDFIKNTVKLWNASIDSFVTQENTEMNKLLKEKK